MFARVHHIGIAVADMERALRVYASASGAEVLGREPSADGSIEIAMLRLGGDLIELLSPREGESAIQKFIERRGEGLHHVAWEVADIERELRRLKEEGYPLVDERPRPGAMRSRIAFLHPKGTLGTLWELVEPARRGEA